MSLQMVTLTERPDLRAAIFADEMQYSIWPEFMRHDPVADLYYARGALDRYLDFVLVGIIGEAVVARAFSVPFCFGIAGRRAGGAGPSRARPAAMKANARARGFPDLYAPLRPNQKHLQPHTPMAQYVQRLRPDGLPADAWLRTHVRDGGRVVKLAACSMTIVGTVAEWSSS